ncbi:helix-turn-helix transcriptional regulator [Paenibacillus sp. Root444D2]|uniref:helix-turn-helix transcriptional regulator n=1 Tax=Paenibacillus sp. Root444D2 TaxID=1736538 RepID=UPI00070C5B7F|nr:YafY family protein [Paenibacillus sp. Root444D2]KQX44659.1 transcriptional regulator [Paenibacillus sp. Root444D2]
MPISRHFEIVYMLLHKKKITAGELAEHFEVSTRTIHRDIDILSAAGIPVYSSKGKGGGISLLDGYVFNASLLTNREQDDILMAMQTLVATEFPDTEEVLSKLARLFKKEKSSWIEVDFSPWGSEESYRHVFPLLRQAIADHLSLTFRYYSAAGKQSTRIVEPVQLIFKSNAWYLACHCLTSDDSRVFKISRMREIVITGHHFKPKPPVASIDLAEENTVRDAVDVTLRLSVEGAYRVYDEFSPAMITVNEDSSFTIQGAFPIGTWFIGYLLTFGTLLEEVAPEHLRAKLLAHLDVMRSKLGSGLSER